MTSFSARVFISGNSYCELLMVEHSKMYMHMHLVVQRRGTLFSVNSLGVMKAKFKDMAHR